jgi:DNA-binding NarL/FixJ family response regulator
MRVLESRVPALVVAAVAGLVTGLLGAGLAPASGVAVAVILFAELAGLHAAPDPTPPAPDLTTPLRGDLHPLSKREAEVARLVAEGLTNKEIAVRIWRSDRVVDTHVQHSFNKLGFHNRSELTRWVVERDLMQPSKGPPEKSVPRNE